jgi:mannosyltransferase
MSNTQRDPSSDFPRSGAPEVLVRPPVLRPGLPGWLLLGVISVGAILRLGAASHGGLWRDEALFLFVSRIEPLSKLLNFLRLHESHPPGFYLLMRWWSGLLGRSESAAVGLSLVFGVALIPLAYYVASRLFSWRVGLYAAALVSVSPPLIQLSILVRPYAMLAVLCILTAYLLWECLRGAPTETWVLYVLSMLVMLYTHNWILLLFGAHVLIGITWLAARPPSERRALLRPWIRAQGFILLGYEPWIPFLIHQFRHAGHAPSPSLKAGPYFVAAKVLAGAKPSWVLAMLLLAGLAGWLNWRRTRVRPSGDGLYLGLAITAGIPAIVMLMALALSGSTNLLPPWCVAVLSPLALLLIARFLAWVHETGAWREAYVSGGALLVLYCLSWYRDPEDLKSNARETANAVASRAGSRDLIIVTPEPLASSFNYYFRAGNPQIDFPAMKREQVVRYDDRLNRFSSEADLGRAMARIDSARAQGRRVWFVMEATNMADRFVRPLGVTDTARGYLQPLVLKRSNQLRQHLVSLYGPPTLRLMPAPREQALELLGALLFEPVSRSNSASLAGRVSCEIIVPAGRRDGAELQADTSAACGR